MAHPHLIATDPALARCAEALAHRPSPSVYLDTEFDAGRDKTTLCLLQLCDGRESFVIDALKVDLAPLAGALTGEGAEWVLHAGRQDVELLCSALSLREPPVLFDTQIAWALTTPEAGVSLAYIEYRALGVRAGKAHQADDWRRRPLSESQIAYAKRDVEHLPELRRRLGQRLDEHGRLSICHDASREAIWPGAEPRVRLSLSSFRNAWQLDAPSQAALLSLIDLANRSIAAHGGRELPSDGKTWLSIAARLPRRRDELARIKGVPSRFVSQHGDEVVHLVAQAIARSHEGFVPLEPPPYVTTEELLARARLEMVRARACELLSAAPELVLPNRLLERMASALLSGEPLRSLLSHCHGFRLALLSPIWADAITPRW